jgi:hypothetical protein
VKGPGKHRSLPGYGGDVNRWRSVDSDNIAGMRTLIPILSVLLALLAAGSIAYIAWKLSSDKPDRQAADPPNNSGEPD